MDFFLSHMGPWGRVHEWVLGSAKAWGSLEMSQQSWPDPSGRAAATPATEKLLTS